MATIGSPNVPRNLCEALAAVTHRVAGVYLLHGWLTAESLAVSWEWDRRRLAQLAGCSISTATRARRWLLDNGWMREGERGELWPVAAAFGEASAQYFRLPRGVLRAAYRLRSAASWRLVWWLLPRIRACYWHGRSRFQLSARWLSGLLRIDRDAARAGLAELRDAGLVSAVWSGSKGTQLAAFCRLSAAVTPEAGQKPDTAGQKPATPKELNIPDSDSKSEARYVPARPDAVGELLRCRVGLGWSRTTAAISAWLGSTAAAEKWLTVEAPQLAAVESPAGWLVYCFRQGWDPSVPSEASSRKAEAAGGTRREVLALTRIGAHSPDAPSCPAPTPERIAELAAEVEADLAERVELMQSLNREPAAAASAAPQLGEVQKLATERQKRREYNKAQLAKLLRRIA